MEVIGVVSDFHYKSLHTKIAPLVLIPDAAPSKIFVRLQDDTSETLREVQSTWEEATSGKPFDYAYLTSSYASVHRDTSRAGNLISGFSIMSIIIACFGLYGLTAHSVQRRKTEIGIRKALGATSTGIMGIVVKRYVILAVVAYVISAPLVYFGMSRWLERFAYRTDIGVGVFIAAAFSLLVVVIGTVAVHAYRASTLDPKTAIHSE